MRLLLLGKNGQVGWELQRALQPLGELIALDRTGRDGLSGDLSRPESLRATVRALRPDCVINAAAYNAVDQAESDVALATRVNGEAPGVLAEEVARLGGWLVHYSTDYVFDGSGNSPWAETDAPRPLSRYGESKRAGELAIADSGCRHLIFRTSWVYGARGNNFAKTMVRLGRERESLNVIDDQVGTPTGAELLADVTAHALRQVLNQSDGSGLYHLAAAGETSWYGYACFVFEQVRRLGQPLKVERVEPIPTEAYPLPAPRPRNSRLATDKLQARFGLRLPPWQAGVARMIEEWMERK